MTNAPRQRNLDCHYRQGLLDVLHDNVSLEMTVLALYGDEMASEYLRGVSVGVWLLVG